MLHKKHLLKCNWCLVIGKLARISNWNRAGWDQEGNIVSYERIEAMQTFWMGNGNILGETFVMLIAQPAETVLRTDGTRKYYEPSMS